MVVIGTAAGVILWIPTGCIKMRDSLIISARNIAIAIVAINVWGLIDSRAILLIMRKWLGISSKFHYLFIAGVSIFEALIVLCALGYFTARRIPKHSIAFAFFVGFTFWLVQTGVAYLWFTPKYGILKTLEALLSASKANVVMACIASIPSGLAGWAASRRAMVS